MDPIQNQKSGGKSGKGGMIATILAILLIVGGAFAYFRNSGNSRQDQTSQTPIDTTNTPADQTANNSVSATPVVVNSKYKDGTYSAEGSYQSPGGTETIKVTVVLKNDIITDATVVSILAEREQSHEFQGMFISNFKQYVIGKNIDQVHLSKVSGSSLTSGGFNAALTQIKSQAA